MLQKFSASKIFSETFDSKRIMRDRALSHEHAYTFHAYILEND